MEELNNDRNFLNSQKSNWLIFGILAAIFIGVFAFNIHAIAEPFSKSKMAEIRQTWTYYSQNDPHASFKSRHVQRLMNVEENEVMVMSRKMKQQVDNPVLLLQGNHQWLRVLLDGKELYRHAPKSADSAHENPGALLTEIQLPKDYVGQTLKVEVASPYKQYTGLPARVFVGNTDSVLSYIISVSMPQMVMMILSLVIGLTTMVFAGRIIYKEKRLDASLLLFSCFAFTIGLEALAGDIISGLLFSPTVNSTLANLLAILTPLFLVSFYCLKMVHVRRYYQLFVVPYLTFSIIILLSVLVTDVNLAKVKIYTDSLNIFGTLATSLACIAEAHYKNRFFVICSPWILLVALAHCFQYISSITGSNHSLINYSGLFFMAIMAVMYAYLIIDFIIENDKNKRQVNFLEVKTSLLEENRQAVIDHLAELETMRQEFKQNLLMIRELAQDNNFAGANEYIEKIITDAEAIESIQTLSQHSLTNLILTRYQKMAAQKSIATEFNVNLPDTLQISDEDLTQLFGHVLDHAFREAYAITDPSKRKITLNVSFIDQQLQITCEHSANYQDNIFGKGITADLPEKEEFDLWVIENISKKYAGQIQKNKNDLTDHLKIQLLL